ncbi:uncharacterized protein LOC127834109 [Dreissena polymorpha]|uniref:Fatty acid desaturase domain-containing protein n=1 Tax=Dreissena polymorpha TaxID=45954 RepID=A0A9D4FX48_DREPO|nr:uncharacterized protein LOC127834109 [Dreissena polymorpha]KAH3806635.1 hypothetical protein DPMN_134959 [Dreissena polymorpha]
MTSSTAQSPLNNDFPTILQLKAAIPRRLFESRASTSLYYVAKDFAVIGALIAGARLLEFGLPAYLQALLLPVYWYVQGTMLMALFVLGHDCGHGSFSRYELLNDCMGTVLHTAVLTPYYPWKLSHHNHHKHTGNIDKDEVFYPIRTKNENGKDFPFLFGLGFGWFAYLWRGYHPRKVCHFNPLEAMFGRHVRGCTLSVLALAGWVSCLYYCACVYGTWALVKYYIVPEIVFASWLLVVTFLHHIEEDTPWYSDEHWTYVKGQLSSIDRKYGWAHDVIHNIGTHQVHHLFSKVPHYHLEEATKHFRANFPNLARTCDRPILSSLVRMYQKFAVQYRIGNDKIIHVYN